MRLINAHSAWQQDLHYFMLRRFNWLPDKMISEGIFYVVFVFFAPEPPVYRPAFPPRSHTQKLLSDSFARRRGSSLDVRRCDLGFSSWKLWAGECSRSFSSCRVFFLTRCLSEGEPHLLNTQLYPNCRGCVFVYFCIIISLCINFYPWCGPTSSFADWFRGEIALKLLNGAMLVLIYFHQLNEVLEEFLRDLAAYLRDGIMQLWQIWRLHVMPNLHHIPATLCSMEIWWLFKVWDHSAHWATNQIDLISALLSWCVVLSGAAFRRRWRPLLV